ncbi:uncharacterized protein LOC144701028 isoform X2 [Wolffia australiana]
MKRWGLSRRGASYQIAVLTSQLREKAAIASVEGRVTPSPWARVLHSCSTRPSLVDSSFFRFFTTAPDDLRHRSASSEQEDVDGDCSTRAGFDDRDGESGSETEDWEEESDSEPQIGDGKDGGGIVLGKLEWGQRALSLAEEVLHRNFGEDFKIFAFRISPRGYIYVRLDKISNRYGCPEMEEIEKFSTLYDECIEESGDKGEIPKDLGLEVSSPGAERLLKVPEELERFKEMPMLVVYEDENDKNETKSGVFQLDTVDSETQLSVWKLVNVKENRILKDKGRPMSRQRRDWRLKTFH